ncbi:MAG: C40 family peptidase [Piscirickettsiaceae bacterium]|nr:C40 family peptidase [Piscirickettsiaceae bacterium]
MKIQAYAESLLGISYQYGGATPRAGFDCSGLTMFVHKQNGITIPRVTRDQFK